MEKATAGRGIKLNALKDRISIDMYNNDVGERCMKGGARSGAFRLHKSLTDIVIVHIYTTDTGLTHS
jgi:hypothetical protein